MNQHMKPHSISQAADELEEEMMHELERVMTKSTLHYLAEGEIKIDTSAAAWAKNPKAIFNMGADPRLPPMPAKPTLIDYFRCRFASHAHLLQSATHALKAGHDEKVVLACLLHDIGVVSFIRCDHGYWGAQMIEPYVDEEVSWAVRTHQALRFFPDESVGYTYPEMYIKRFGHIMVRHICADGLLSSPSPSSGWRKLRPMMSTKSSRLTLASGSNE